mgnify:CR=1 FL=1
MNAWSVRLAGALVAVVLCAVPTQSLAGASYDFLFSMDRVGDDHQYFLNVAVSNYGYDRVALEPVLPRLTYVEADLPVAMFLAHECRRPPEYIVDLRARGMSWSMVFSRVGVPYDTLFYRIDRDPGPPYGKAWGHWRKNPRGVRLSDADIRGLVQVQVGARAARMAPYEMARARGRGRPVYVVVADEKGRPYHKGKHGKEGHGHKSHGHGHEHGPHDND